MHCRLIALHCIVLCCVDDGDGDDDDDDNDQSVNQSINQ